jgi:hypothetical protein
MTNPPNDPKDAPRRETTEQDRADPSRKGHGPNNPLPGEPGGPSTAGYSAEDRKAAEEGQRKEREAKDKPADHSKR